MTATAVRARSNDLLGLLDPATYRRTAHLLVDLPLGLATFSLALTLLSLSAGLAITLVGLPLLVVALAGARLVGRFERARAALLLDVHVPAPAPRRGFRGRLTDAAAWRALGYAVLLGPVGTVTGTLTLTGWTTALAATAFPAYAWTLQDPALHLGGLTVDGLPAAVGSVAVGLLLLAAMPAVTRLLAQLDAVLVRGLLRS